MAGSPPRKALPAGPSRRLTPYRGTACIFAALAPTVGASGMQMNELSFEVDGMTCGSCTARVQRALAAVEGVRDVVVTGNPGRALLKSDGAVDAAELLEAIRGAGYEARVAD